MRRPILIATVLATLFYAGPAQAPPPLPAFPANLRPLSGGAPFNTRIWAFGTNAPPLAQISATLTIDGAPAVVSLEAHGCCAVAATLVSPRTGTATVVVTSPAATLSTTFSIGAASDTTPPTLRPPRILEDLGGRLIIGVEGTDDVGLAGFFARVGGEIRGSAPPGYLIDTTRGSDGCASITAVDLAGNESAALEACGMRPDGGVADDAGLADAGNEPAADGCDCSATSSGRVTPLLALLALVWARKRLSKRGPESTGASVRASRGE